MYGNPTFRFTLTHSIQGSQIISEPVGWHEAKLKLERHEDYHSLVEYFEGSFTFYGTNGVEDGGLEFIKTVERLYGVDANIDFLVEISFDDGYTFDTVFIGLLDLSDLQETKNNKVEIPVIRNDFWANFINRRETPVNLQDAKNLNGDPVNIFENIDLDLTSQTLRSAYLNEQETGEISDLPGVGYYQLTPNGRVLDEIEETYILPFGHSTTTPVWWLEPEYEGEYNFDLRIELSQLLNVLGNTVLTDFASGGITAPTTFVLVKNEETPIPFVRVDNFGSYDGSDVYSCWDTVPGVSALGSTIFSLSTSIYLLKDDVIRIYLNRLSGSDTVIAFLWGKEGVPCLDSSFDPKVEQTGRPDGMAEVPTYFSVIADTIFPQTTGEAFLIHDAAGQIIDRITAQSNRFYSEYLGSTQTNYRQYISDGCEWRHALIQGLQIRGYNLSDKQFSMSFKKWWDGANPILNLGLGYEIINGVEVIRVEDKEYFFRPDPSVYIDNVYELMREYDKSRIYKKIEVGYNKWQSEDVSGIDDPQTKHTYATRLEKIGTDFRIYSDFIAASLAIEVTRRKKIKKSEDYKFDNEVFIIAINDIDGSPDRYRPALMEDFNFVTNLLNAETRYNLRLTPARNLLRWINFLNNGLQSYIGSLYKFTAGEGNYDMTSDMVISTPGCDGDFSGEVLSEKQDIQVTDEYVFIPQEFTAEIDLSWEDYKTIRNNPRNAIGISQTESDHVAFYIKSLEYQPVHGKAVFKMWPVVPFYMSTSDYVPVNMVCTEDCVDAITDGVDALTDELGECITV